MPAADELERDDLLDLISGYASSVQFETLAPETAHATKRRIIDTLGVVYAGFDGPPSAIARNLALIAYPASMATILGTSSKTTVDMAAFVNATTTRFPELNDSNHVPGRPGGHPSDVITPLLAVSEYAGSSGGDFIASVALAYEILRRMVEASELDLCWDPTNFVSLATAVGSARLLKLDESQVKQAISMTVVPNNALRRSRLGLPTMWKATASGQAGRAGVFAAMLARAGMRGPTLPYEGDAGWRKNVARNVDLAIVGDPAPPTRIHVSVLKPRACCGIAMASALAAEKAHDPEKGTDGIERVVVETFEYAKVRIGTDPELWRPKTKEAADHSIPYVVAAAITDGYIGLEQFNEQHLQDASLRNLIDKVEIQENPEFSRAYVDPPHLHCTRVTVHERDGGVRVGQSGGTHGEIGDEWTDEAIETKLRGLAAGHLARDRADDLLAFLWQLEKHDVAAVPLLMVSERSLTATPPTASLIGATSR